MHLIIDFRKSNMNIESFRDYCLSLPGVQEKMPFGKATSEYDRNLLVFHVCDKWFCFVNIDCFDFCVIKCPTDQIEELRAQYDGVRLGYHMNKKHWISVYFNLDVPDRIILNLVLQSYQQVVASLPKCQREALSALHSAESDK